MQEIDFVIPWVNGQDPDWQREKRKYTPGLQNDDRVERYRDWDNLMYWFRGVEKFAPWVRKIHFITCGHLPEWLNINHPKLHIVKHSDYIPKEYLPVFSSHPIELNMHRIHGLAEHFVYFNDDFFVLKEIDERDFFINGKPVDMLALQPVVANPDSPAMSYIYLNNMMTLAKYYKKRENIKKQPAKYFHIGYPLLYFCYNFLELAFPLFTGLYTVHGPSPFCKSTFEELWKKEEEILRTTSKHRFRDYGDVSQYLFREWQKLSGNFVPRNITRKNRYYNILDDNKKLLRTIRKQKTKIICLNDVDSTLNFEKVKQEIKQAFNEILPEKSGFEL